MNADLDRLEFREVDAGLWADLEGFFKARGGPKHCWCMVWRPMTSEDRRSGAAAKESYLRRLAHDGVPIELLAYLDDEPVAWCSIGPKSTFERLGGPTDDECGTWSITCFFVHRTLRGAGMTRRLIEAAIEHARTKGAIAVEAYPVDPDSPSYRYMGYVGTFGSMGFREVGRKGIRRHVMRLSLSPS